MHMMSRKVVRACLISFTALLIVGGATAIRALATQTGQPADVSGTPPVSAQLVTPDFGWYMTAGNIMITRNGGRTFADAHAPLPFSYARNALFTSAQDGIAAAADGNRIVVARTVNGGRTWTASQIADPRAYPGTGYESLSIAFGSRSAGAILAQVGTGSSFSVGTLFTTDNAGATWQVRPAPVAGTISEDSHGGIWLAGGVYGNELFRTTDRGASWARSAIRLASGQQLGAVSTPSGGMLTATALLRNGTTQVDTLTSADGGRSWHAISTVPIRGKTTSGVLVTVARTAHGMLVLDTAGDHVYSSARGTGRWQSSGRDGLPEGVTGATFAPGGSAGWVLATYGHCARFKSACTLYHVLAGTTDAGTSWHQLILWSDPLN
jgi:hypothetical protein